jgi:hypothetical protein
MKRILQLTLGYFLVIQAGFGVLGCCGQPENAALILIVSGFLGWGGYKLIHIGRRSQKQLSIEDSPTKQLAVPETNKLDRK